MTLATRSKLPVTPAGPDVSHEGEVPNSAGARTAGACLIALWAAILVAAEVRAVLEDFLLWRGSICRQSRCNLTTPDRPLTVEQRPS